MQEKREHRRYRAAVTAEIEIDGDVVTGETRDMSVGGASAIVDNVVADGQQVALTLILTQDGVEDPNEEPFEVQAEVIWSAPTDDDNAMVGLRFGDLSPPQRAHLERFLAALAEGG